MSEGKKQGRQEFHLSQGGKHRILAGAQTPMTIHGFAGIPAATRGVCRPADRRQRSGSMPTAGAPMNLLKCPPSTHACGSAQVPPAHTQPCTAPIKAATPPFPRCAGPPAPARLTKHGIPVVVVAAHALLEGAQTGGEVAGAREVDDEEAARAARRANGVVVLRIGALHLQPDGRLPAAAPAKEDVCRLCVGGQGPHVATVACTHGGRAPRSGMQALGGWLGRGRGTRGWALGLPRHVAFSPCSSTMPLGSGKPVRGAGTACTRSPALAPPPEPRALPHRKG